MPPNLALRLTLIRSNYPCLEHIFMAPNVFEPLKFYCSYYFYRCYTKTSLTLVSIHLDEILAPPALDHGVACSSRAGGEILSQLKEHLIAQSS